MPKAKLVLKGEDFEVVRGLASEGVDRMVVKIDAGPYRDPKELAFYKLRLKQYQSLMSRCDTALSNDRSQDAEEEEDEPEEGDEDEDEDDE